VYGLSQAEGPHCARQEQGVSKLSMLKIAPVWTLHWPLSLTSQTRSTLRAEQRPVTVSPASVRIV
jgi:hypothetical protein